MKKLLVLCCFLAVAFFCTSAGAVTFTVSHHTSEANAKNALSTWLSGLGTSTYYIYEDFEGFDLEMPLGPSGFTRSPTGGQQYYDTPVGTFEAGELAGQGDMSFNKQQPKIGVMERDVPGLGTGNYGRTLNWAKPDSFFGNQYLDSGDVSLVVLNHTLVNLELTTLFFFMFDVADQGGTMKVTAGNDSSDYKIPEESGRLPNGAITFVGIKAHQNEFISKISWLMTVNETNDGWGIDNIGGTKPVPEPATMLLLGFGLLGLAVAGRRFRKN